MKCSEAPHRSSALPFKVAAQDLGQSREALRVADTGAVYHVTVSCAWTKPAAASSNLASWRYPLTDGEPGAANAARVAFDENLRNLERFNRDAATVSRAQEELPNADGVLEYTRALFGQADALALVCRNWTDIAMIAIFRSIAIALFLFSLYTNVFTDVPQLYFAFIGVVVAAFTVGLVARRKRMQDRFQDYRALAEGLRVQFYWQLAGIHESVYEHYLARQEGSWIGSETRCAPLNSIGRPSR